MGRVKLLDLYSDAVLVPTAVRADHVRQLRGGALGADATGRALEAPVGRATATR